MALLLLTSALEEVSFKLLPLYPRRKSPEYLLDKRMDGFQSRPRLYE
jgi:hypothetical protein